MEKVFNSLLMHWVITKNNASVYQDIFKILVLLDT